MLKKMKSQARASLAAKRPGLIKMLNQIGDFYLEFKWDFQSWSESRNKNRKRQN